MSHGHVADAMVLAPKVHGATATVADLRALFDDDHVHAALIVDGRRLVAVVERSDLAGAGEEQLAAGVGRLAGRTVSPTDDLETVRQQMVAAGLRRLAVVDDHHDLLGLLCLKRTGLGFCTDSGIAARAAERSCAASMQAAER